jgi:hypothetical protein
LQWSSGARFVKLDYQRRQTQKTTLLELKAIHPKGWSRVINAD